MLVVSGQGAPLPPRANQSLGHGFVNWDDTTDNLPPVLAKAEMLVRDCRRTQPKFYKRAELCFNWRQQHPNQQQPMFREFNTILAVDTRVHRQITHRCTRRVTTHSYVCGGHSHVKILGPPTIAELLPLTDDECRRLIQQRVLTTEMNQRLPLREGEEVTYQYVAVGRLDRTFNDITCFGGKGHFAGTPQEDMIQTKSVNVRLDRITLQARDGHWRDPDAGVILPQRCTHEHACLAYGRTYVYEKRESCTLERLLAVPMQRGIAEFGVLDQNVVHSTSHEMVLRLGSRETLPLDCAAKLACANCHMRPTQVQGLFTLEHLHSNSVPHAAWDRNATVDSYVSLEVVSQLRAQYQQYRHHLEQVVTAPTYLTLACNGPEGTFVSDPIQEEYVFESHGELVAHYACPQVPATLHWSALYSKDDLNRPVVRVSSIQGKYSKDYDVVLPQKILVHTSSSTAPVNNPITMEDFAVIKMNANEEFYRWKTRNATRARYGKFDFKVGTWALTQNARVPWRASWLSQTQALLGQVQGFAVFTDEGGIVSEDDLEEEITEEEISNYTSADWAKKLRHTATAGRVLAKAFALKKKPTKFPKMPTKAVNATWQLINKVYGMLSDAGGFTFVLMALTKVAIVIFKAAVAFKSGKKKKADIILEATRELTPIIKTVHKKRAANRDVENSRRARGKWRSAQEMPSAPRFPTSSDEDDQPTRIPIPRTPRVVRRTHSEPPPEE